MDQFGSSKAYNKSMLLLENESREEEKVLSYQNGNCYSLLGYYSILGYFGIMEKKMEAREVDKIKLFLFGHAALAPVQGSRKQRVTWTTN